MEMEIQFQGQDAKEQTILAFQDWVKREEIKGLHVQRKSVKPKPGEMGLDPGTILNIVLGSAAVVELVKSLHIWITTRRPKLTVKLKVGDSQVELDAENLPDQQVTIERVLSLVKAQGSK